MDMYERMLEDTTLVKQIGEGFGGGRAYRGLQKNNAAHMPVKV